MNRNDKNRIIALYESRYKDLGYDIKTVGWRDREQQYLRFKVLTEPFDLSGASVCDVGCGFGDLFTYIKEKFDGVKYTGIDIAPSLIVDASKRHPDADFLVADILKDDFRRSFDYVFLSGALNCKISGNIAFARKMIKKMFCMSRKGIAFNMFTAYVDYKEGVNFYYRPEEFFRYAKQLSRFASLRHDYPLWEFTIHILKDRPCSKG